MLNNVEKLIQLLQGMPLNDVRSAFITRIRIESGRLNNARQWARDNGFEPVPINEGLPITSDGREVLRLHDGSYWALRPEIHAERLAAALAAAKKPQPEIETKSVVGTESLSAMACPKCGDSLQHTAVCPKCAAGKLGYRHRYTCVCGGVDLISKDKL